MQNAHNFGQAHRRRRSRRCLSILLLTWSPLKWTFSVRHGCTAVIHQRLPERLLFTVHPLFKAELANAVHIEDEEKKPGVCIFSLFPWQHTSTTSPERASTGVGWRLRTGVSFHIALSRWMSVTASSEPSRRLKKKLKSRMHSGKITTR